MANVNNDQHIRNMQSQYGNKTIKIGTGKDAQKINTSVFSNGMSITSDVKVFLNRFDSDQNGKIDEKEAVVLQKVLVDYAGKNKALSKEEFAQMVGQDVNSPQCEKMYKSFQVLVERQTKGLAQTTITNKDGSKVTSNFNADGSGTQVTEGKDVNGQPFKLTEIFTKGGVKIKGVRVKADGTTITSDYTNNADGKPIKITSTVVDKDGKLQNVSVSERTYDDKGNMLTNKTVTAGPDKKPIKSSMVTNTYNDDGKKVSSNTVIQDGKKGTKVTKDATYNPETGKITTEKSEIQKVVNGKLETVDTAESTWTYGENGNLTKWETNGINSKGKPYNIVDNYAPDGKIVTSREHTYYKGDNLYKDSYNGENIENRKKGGIPSERFIYEADGVTVKEKIVNKFDEKGVIIGQEKYDKDGKLIESRDFSQIDGNFDTAYQGSRGDCYLLAAINGLAQSEDGQKLLQQNVKQNTDGSFEITLPGAEAIRNDILAGKLGSIPADKVNIESPITITKEELDAAMLKTGASYSSGDKDVLLLELAYEKYRNAVAEFSANNNLKAEDCKGIPMLSQTVSSIEHKMGGAGDNLSGGQTFEATYILTGKSSAVVARKPDEVPTCYVSQPDMQMSIPTNESDAKPMSGEKFDKMIESLIKDSADGKIDNFSATVGFNISQQEVNGEIVQGSGHAFSIKSMTKDQVVLANPWDPEKDIVMSMEDFKKGVKSFSMTPLNDKAKIGGADAPGGSDGPNGPNDSNGPGGAGGTEQPTTTYEVKRGDNLWKIAKRQLGAGAKNSQIADLVQKIIKANPQIKNPNLIYVGDKINIPS